MNELITKIMSDTETSNENSYTIKILCDYRDVWTESALGPFKRIDVFHIKTNMSRLQICNFIAKTFIQFEHEKECHDGDIATCILCANTERCFYDSNDSDERTKTGSKAFRDFLFRDDICIYQQDNDKYWKRTYISVTEVVDPVLAVSLTKNQLVLLLKPTIQYCVYS